MTDGVVLLHGILRTRHSMGRLERFLQKAGYATLNIGYPSKYSLEDLTELLHEKIAAFADTISGSGRLHFVGHSMGGLLIRAYLLYFPPEKLGRVVMLATPNHGSEIVDVTKNWWLYKLVYGDSGQQLGTCEDGFEQTLGKVTYELGIIAGDRPLAAISTKFFGQPNDGKVSVASTELNGMTDHIVIHTSHTLMLINETVQQQTLYFLQHGHFLRES